MLVDYNLFDRHLSKLSSSKQLITTINAYSYIIAKKDRVFNKNLLKSDVLLPDGISIVWAIRWLNNQKLKKIAGNDLFLYEMNQLQKINGKCFFLGSSESTLEKIKKRAALEYPNVKIEIHSPPYKPEFSEEENNVMITSVNAFQPDVLFIGLTAPKQEKWAYQHFEQLKAGHICCIGAVFDFYAGTVKRAPNWVINIGFEWLYRFLKEPRRMWRRYLIGNLQFIYLIIKEKITLIKQNTL